MTDADAIARFIAERGVTRCPTVFMWPSQAARDMRGSLPVPKPWVPPSKGTHRTMARLQRKRREMRAYEDAGR